MDIHRCRFVHYPPSAINALAFSHPSAETPFSKKSHTPPTLRLALGRANGDIEIWNPCDGVWNQETILRSGKDRSIEGLAWVQDPEDVDKNGQIIPGKLRLFSIGYSTSVTEWDLAHGKPVRHSGGNYGEIWCMAAQPRDVVKSTSAVTNGEAGDGETQGIAVGCADGAIVLHSTEDGDLRFKKLVARSSKKGSRVLSITFQNRYTVITGHADSTIRVYDIRNGRQVRNITLGGGPKGGPRETLVWSVRCLSDGSIVSGDSTGMMCFWNGKTYSLTQRIKAHDADILDVAVSADGQSVFSGGMDRKTCFYKRSVNETAPASMRWAKISHSRMHDHDVKTMATYESKNLSVLASGGLDTIPIIVPLQEYGREHFRRLGSLPERPPLLSVPKQRLVISWWDREINIWSISTGSNDRFESHNGKNWRLVAKAMLTGEESIAAVSVTSTGSLLAVSTITSTKIFRLSRRKDGTVKLQKMVLPSSLANCGGKLLQFSPNTKWLCVVLSNDEVRLYGMYLSDSEESISSMQYAEKPVTLRRISRTGTQTNPGHGALGTYTRSINQVSFSEGSDILAVSDLSGYLDTWVLRETFRALPKIELTAEGSEMRSPSPASSSADSANSSDASDSESGQPRPTDTQHEGWLPNPSGPLLPKLPSAVLVLSFRPSPSASFLQNQTVPPTSEAGKEDRLLVLTTNNRLFEFHALAGKLTDWSRRNPPLVFPSKYRRILDQAKGVVWDIRPGRVKERVWIYGVAWLWMIDLKGDIRKEEPGIGNMPKQEQRQKSLLSNHGDRAVEDDLTNGIESTDADEDDNHNPDHRTDPSTTLTTTETPNQAPRKKRKFNNQPHLPPSTTDNDTPLDDPFPFPHHLPTTGAGSLIAPSELQTTLGHTIRRIDSAGADITSSHNQTPSHKTQPLPLDSPNAIANVSENPEPHALLSLRRHPPPPHNTDDRSSSSLPSVPAARDSTTKAGGRAQSFHSFKYRPILGIVPISLPSSSGAGAGEGEGEEVGGKGGGIEVVLVERPDWDLDLPGRFVEEFPRA